MTDSLRTMWKDPLLTETANKLRKRIDRTDSFHSMRLSPFEVQELFAAMETEILNHRKGKHD